MIKIRCIHERTKQTDKGKVCLDCGERELTKKEIEELYNDGKSVDYELEEEKQDDN